jgi:hypothetical protein
VTNRDPKQLLGKPEDEHLELKAAEALRRPADIAKEVVGFLNGSGGEVWIGIEENEGVAINVQTIENVEDARRSLLDYLVEVLEPRFGQDEVRVDCVAGVLVVVVKKGSDRPYAVRDNGRRFVVRIADRLREMTREEIARDFRQGGPNQEQTRQSSVNAKNTLRKAQEHDGLQRDQLWLRIVPVEPLAIDFADKATQERFRAWLTDPTTTGNRRSGWNFANDLARLRFPGGTKAEQGTDADYKRISVNEDGQVTFAVDVHALSRIELPIPVVLPYAALEYPASVFRFMARILEVYPPKYPDPPIIAGIVIKGMRGWTLRPGSPREPVDMFEKVLPLAKDIIEIDPDRLEFSAKQVQDEPDRCALRIVRRIYGEFGLAAEDIPREFDQTRGVLILD